MRITHNMRVRWGRKGGKLVAAKRRAAKVPLGRGRVRNRPAGRKIFHGRN